MPGKGIYKSEQWHTLIVNKQLEYIIYFPPITNE